MAAKILGKLYGLIASAVEGSRNGRKYTEHFWDTIFNSDLFLEGIKNRVYFGELWHPDDDEEYSQIHPGDKSAILLTKIEKKGKNYYGTFDICPTRAGEVLKNLIDIGCKFGISSRGTSDSDRPVFDDPSTYNLVTFDIVAFPGIKSARLQPVTMVSESFGKRKSLVKIKENLNHLAEQDIYAKNYIEEVLAKKENTDNNLAICEKYGMLPEEIEEHIITVDDNGELTVQKEQGPIKVIDYNDLKVSPGDMLFADNLIYDEHKNCYIIFGDVFKLEKL